MLSGNHTRTRGPDRFVIPKAAGTQTSTPCEGRSRAAARRVAYIVPAGGGSQQEDLTMDGGSRMGGVSPRFNQRVLATVSSPISEVRSWVAAGRRR